MHLQLVGEEYAEGKYGSDIEKAIKKCMEGCEVTQGQIVMGCSTATAMLQESSQRMAVQAGLRAMVDAVGSEEYIQSVRIAATHSLWGKAQSTPDFLEQLDLDIVHAIENCAAMKSAGRIVMQACKAANSMHIDKASPLEESDATRQSIISSDFHFATKLQQEGNDEDSAESKKAKRKTPTAGKKRKRGSNFGNAKDKKARSRAKEKKSGSIVDLTADVQAREDEEQDDQEEGEVIGSEEGAEEDDPEPV